MAPALAAVSRETSSPCMEWSRCHRYRRRRDIYTTHHGHGHRHRWEVVVAVAGPVSSRTILTAVVARTT